MTEKKQPDRKQAAERLRQLVIIVILKMKLK